MSGWLDMNSAPRDGTPIRARGRDWGDPCGKLHYVTVHWRKPRSKSDASGGKAWRKVNGDDYACVYLTDWKPA